MTDYQCPLTLYQYSFIPAAVIITSTTTITEILTVMETERKKTQSSQEIETLGKLAYQN